MSVTVFRAVGGAGTQVVDQLKARGHRFTAYRRLVE